MGKQSTAKANPPNAVKKPPLNTCRVYRVGTDCSGIDVPLAILAEMGIQTEHVFSSEKDPCLRTFIAAEHKPETMYPDIIHRDNRTHCPAQENIDLYAVGLPCQPFSKSGKN